VLRWCAHVPAGVAAGHAATLPIAAMPSGRCSRRWVVERTVAWITSYRRCARDYERLPANHEATVYWAMITLMTRRLTRAS
jgi:transposase